MPEQATPVARAARQQGFDPKASAGLFVGVSTFEDEHIQDVPFAVDDAVDLAYLFAVELELLRPARLTLALTGEPKKEASRGRLEELRDAGAEDLPLAVNPGVSEAYEQYRQRRDAARARLGGNLGTVLTGSLFDRIVELIPDERPGHRADVEVLLEEIEALDGSERSQRSLRDYVGEKYGVMASGAQVSVEPVERGMRAVLTQPGAKGLGESRWGKLGSWVGILILIGLVLLGAWAADRWWSEGGHPSVRRPQADAPTQNPDSGAERQPPPPSAPALKAGAERRGPYGMRFRFVPAGTYKVGSPKDEPGRWDDREWLPHDVQLTRGFWIAETEVTQAQWLELMPTNPSSFQNCGGDCPVENVSWFDAVTYANKLSADQGLELCYEGCSGAPDAETYSCEYAESKAGQGRGVGGGFRISFPP